MLFEFSKYGEAYCILSNKKKKKRKKKKRGDSLSDVEVNVLDCYVVLSDIAIHSRW